MSNNYDEYNRAIEQYNERVEVDNATIDQDNVVNKPFYLLRLITVLILFTVGAAIYWFIIPASFTRDSLHNHFTILWGVVIGWFFRWLNYR